MRKRRGSSMLPLRAYLEQQADSNVIPASCKMLYKCDERSGFPINSVTGHAYDPHNLVVTGGIDDGYLAFTVDNAIEFGINSDLISVITEFNATFSTRKVILIAIHVLNLNSGLGTSGTRVAMGTLGSAETGDSPVMSVSFASGMHTQIDTSGSGGAGEIVQIPTDVTRDIYDFTDPKTIYIMWNGLGSSASVAGTLTGKVLNSDGSQYVDTGGQSCLQTTTGILTSDTFTPGNMMRPSSAHYYKMEAWELDYLPLNLDLQLAIWGDLARSGYKGAVILK